VVRPGCNQYCQQAGGYGAGPGHQRPAIKILTRTAHLTPDGSSISIDVKCVFHNTCQGAMLVSLLNPPGSELGRCDLSLGAHKSETVQVPLTAAGSQALGQQGSPVKLAVTADAGQTAGAQNSHKWKFVVPKIVNLVKG
jgi:hypothetical protein